MKYTALPFLSSIVSLLAVAACLGNDSVESVQKLLIPKPRQVQMGAGTFAWDTEIPLIVEPDNSHDRFAAETLIAACRRRELAIPRIRPSRELNPERERHILIGDPSRCWPLHLAMREAGVFLPDEVINQGYVLDITPQRILIAAATSAGVYYGVQTLIQLLPQGQTRATPSLRVTDWSLIRLRGVSIDMYSGDPYEPGFFDRGFLALGYFGVDTLKKLPRDVIVGPWHYGKVKDYPFGDQLQELGFDQFLLTSNASMGRLFPLQNSAAANVESFLPHAHRLTALGVFHTDWNRPGRNTFYEYNWPAAAHFAEWAWCDSEETPAAERQEETTVQQASQAGTPSPRSNSAAWPWPRSTRDPPRTIPPGSTPRGRRCTSSASGSWRNAPASKRPKPC